MVKLTVMYPWIEDYFFDMDYYLNRHIAVHKADPNVWGIIIEEGRSLFRREGRIDNVCIAHFFYESIGKLNESRTPELQKKQMEDIHNFTNIIPLNQISEVEYINIDTEVNDL